MVLAILFSCRTPRQQDNGASKRGDASLSFYPLPFINTRGKGARGTGHHITVWREAQDNSSPRLVSRVFKRGASPPFLLPPPPLEKEGD
jgi:hypothetical protein